MMLVAVAVALMCAMSLPAFEIAACPILNPSPSHHCCPRSKPAETPPSAACISACAALPATFVPHKLPAKVDCAVVAWTEVPAPSHALSLDVSRAVDDVGPPGDLYLQFRVLRR